MRNAVTRTTFAALAIATAALVGCDRDSNTSRNGGTGAASDATNHTSTGMPGAGTTSSGAAGTADRVGTPTTHPTQTPGAAAGGTTSGTGSGPGSGTGICGAAGTGQGTTGAGGAGTTSTPNSGR